MAHLIEPVSLVVEGGRRMTPHTWKIRVISCYNFFVQIF